MIALASGASAYGFLASISDGNRLSVPTTITPLRVPVAGVNSRKPGFTHGNRVPEIVMNGPDFLQLNSSSMPAISSAIGGISTSFVTHGSLSAVTLRAPCTPAELTGHGFGPHEVILNAFIRSTPAP